MQVSKPPHQESAKIPMSRMIVLCRSSEGGDETWTLSASTDSVALSMCRFGNKDREDRYAKAEAIFSSRDSIMDLARISTNCASAYRVKSSYSLSIVKYKCTYRIWLKYVTLLLILANYARKIPKFVPHVIRLYDLLIFASFAYLGVNPSPTPFHGSTRKILM
jgi:hypothetical protein